MLLRKMGLKTTLRGVTFYHRVVICPKALRIPKRRRPGFLLISSIVLASFQPIAAMLRVTVTAARAVVIDAPGILTDDNYTPPHTTYPWRQLVDLRAGFCTH